MNTDNPWITHSTSIGYENPWITVEHNEVTTPGGSPGIYGVVRFKNLAVGVLPIDDEDHTWLVGQYRYALDQYSWEMPAGGSPQGVDPEDTAHRELLEETGLRAGVLTPLLSGVKLTNSVTDETAYCYLATELTMGEAEPEDTEQLQLRRLPVDEVIEMCMTGKIDDSYTLISFFKLAQLRR